MNGWNAFYTLNMILLTQIITEKTHGSHEIFTYLFAIQVVITLIIVIAFLLHIRKSVNKRNIIENNYIKSINELTTNHIEQVEKIRTNSNKREEERSRQWFESEKETLKVLSGVSKLLDLNEKITKIESSKIMLKLDEFHEILKKATSENGEDNGET
jgi:ABC-type multidrug transport system fused ATPase/permease subunit